MEVNKNLYLKTKQKLIRNREKNINIFEYTFTQILLYTLHTYLKKFELLLYLVLYIAYHESATEAVNCKGK